MTPPTARARSWLRFAALLTWSLSNALREAAVAITTAERALDLLERYAAREATESAIREAEAGGAVRGRGGEA